jgi:hypothetical protein
MRLRRRLWAMLRVRRLETDLADELQFHRVKEQEFRFSRAGIFRRSRR